MGVICRAVLKGTLRGTDQVRLVFTYNSDAAGDVPLASDFGTIIPGFFTSDLLSGLSDKLKFDSIAVEIPSGGGWVFQSEAAVSIAGTNTGDMLPQQVAAVVVGITASRRRGKKFIPGCVESNQNGGIIGSAFQADLEDFATAYVASQTIGGDSFDAGVCKPDGSVFIPFNSWRVNTLLGSQRRRKPGVGA